MDYEPNNIQNEMAYFYAVMWARSSVRRGYLWLLYKEILQKLLSREKEIDTLIEGLFLGNLTDERFKKLTYKYEDEQLELKEKIKNIKKEVLEDKKHELDVNGFLDIIKKYSQIENLTIDILNEFIGKIIVHHRETINVWQLKRLRFSIRW